MHTVRTDLAPGLPRVAGDQVQLQQVLINLIMNAVEAMPKGGTLTISSRVVLLTDDARQGKYVALEFKDTGLGMTDEQRSRAFKSVLSTTKARGTGLGLAIVGRVVETHRGEVRIRSRPGHGTVVSVLLPK